MKKYNDEVNEQDDDDFNALSTGSLENATSWRYKILTKQKQIGILMLRKEKIWTLGGYITKDRNK